MSDEHEGFEDEREAEPTPAPAGPAFVISGLANLIEEAQSQEEQSAEDAD